MDAEQLDLELEERILNGTIDAARPPPSVPDGTFAQHGGVHGGSAAIGFEVAPHEPAAASSRAAPMRNPSREKLKRELGFLREYAAELETQLLSLRSQKRPLEASSAAVETLSLQWQRQAETERVKRIRSERENERLRRSLETQLRVAEELSLYLRRQAEATYEYPTHIPPPLLVSSSFERVVEQLLSDIDRAYAVTDSILAGPSWESLPDERVFVTTVKTRQFAGSDQMYIELMDTAYRSHAYERTCEAAWEATRAVYASESRMLDRAPSTHDMLAARYLSAGQTRRGTVKELLVTFVTKRFVGTDRSVFVWRTCGSAAQHDDSDMPTQAVSDETGWMVITKVPEGVPGRPAGTAFFQACSRLVPAWFEGDVPDSSVRTQLAIGEFTNVVLSATEADVTDFETAFQRLVLDDNGRVETITEDHPSDEADEALVAFV